MDIHHFPLSGKNLVRNVGNGCNHVHIELPVESLLNNFKVEESKESAAESKSQRERRFRFKNQGSVIELKFFQRSTKVFIFIGLNRINTGKHHRFNLLESCNMVCARSVNMCNCVPYFDLAGGFYA